MREFAEDNEEDDEAGDPGPVFVHVDDFVAEEGDDERCCRDDDNACVSGNVGIDGIEELGADYHVDGRPAYAGQDVEDSDWKS